MKVGNTAGQTRRGVREEILKGPITGTNYSGSGATIIKAKHIITTIVTRRIREIILCLI